jgi:glycosyltransferase involved in cell wall biosynthesis
MTDLRRLLVAIGSLNSGGAERHLLRVLPELRRRGWPVEVFCTNDTGSLADEMISAGVPVFSPGFQSRNRRAPWHRLIKLSKSFKSLSAHIARSRPGVVHTFLPEAHVVATSSSICARVPLRIIMSRRSLNIYKQRRPSLALLETMLKPAVSMAIGNSQAVVNQLLKEGFPKSKVRLIYNGIDTPTDCASILTGKSAGERLFHPGSVTFIQIANLIPYKGHQDTLTALSIIRHKLPAQWSLLMVGRDDGSGATLKQISRKLGLENNVKWLGERQDTRDLLSVSDIGILSSHQEGFSNAILEKMAANLPVVATDVGGNPEAVIHGETGYIVPVRNPQALAEALLNLVLNPQRKRMGEAGAKRVEEKFTISSCVEAYEACYREVLAQHTTAGNFGRFATN